MATLIAGKRGCFVGISVAVICALLDRVFVELMTIFREMRACDDSVNGALICGCIMIMIFDLNDDSSHPL